MAPHDHLDVDLLLARDPSTSEDPPPLPTSYVTYTSTITVTSTSSIFPFGAQLGVGRNPTATSNSSSKDISDHHGVFLSPETSIAIGVFSSVGAAIVLSFLIWVWRGKIKEMRDNGRRLGSNMLIGGGIAAVRDGEEKDLGGEKRENGSIPVEESCVAIHEKVEAEADIEIRQGSQIELNTRKIGGKYPTVRRPDAVRLHNVWGDDWLHEMEGQGWWRTKFQAVKMRTSTTPAGMI